MLASGLALLLATGVSASSIFDHEEITRKALLEMGWGDQHAIETVAQSNVATDFGRLPSHSRTALNIVLPATSSHVPLVRGLAETAAFSPRGSVGFHFNSLYSYSDISARWAALDSWANSVCYLIEHEPNSERRQRLYLVLLGLVSHSVQDFYAHSNWIEILDGFDSQAKGFDSRDLPIWEELVENASNWRAENPDFSSGEAIAQLLVSNQVLSHDDCEGGLQTGSVRGERFEGTPPWKHRHNGGKEKDAVHDLAKRATQYWVARIDRRLQVGDPTVVLNTASD